MEAMPIPSAMMKGTVMGPVVTPPESKATARNSLGIKNASRKTTAYSASSTQRSGIFSRLRTAASTRNTPTPTATVTIIVRSGTAGTCLASTCRSGSATVMATPISRQTAISPPTFLDLASWPPMASPMGIMAISAPREKKPIPTISITAPMRNIIMVPTGSGASVKLNSNTMAVIGNTEDKASRIFSASFFFTHTPPLLNFHPVSHMYTYVIENEKRPEPSCPAREGTRIRSRRLRLSKQMETQISGPPPRRREPSPRLPLPPPYSRRHADVRGSSPPCFPGKSPTKRLDRIPLRSQPSSPEYDVLPCRHSLAFPAGQTRGHSRSNPLFKIH